MYIRSYRRPIEIPLSQKINLSDIIPYQQEYEEVFVILEEPLLEFSKKDLAYLKALKIDVFSE